MMKPISNLVVAQRAIARVARATTSMATSIASSRTILTRRIRKIQSQRIVKKMKTRIRKITVMLVSTPIESPLRTKQISTLSITRMISTRR